ncbi:PREDICTED: carboxypeptidase Q-like [Branchiostoma belcheri]|uniref:Carboxypeptidase Q n=1 Tax=Branchiostoma belcheri TaxID=7741 RepID=A0A6P5AH75_BRABE|nr:PREDICTED: carboxypeptidase Q-like [Branchiostoma belcheri]
MATARFMLTLLSCFSGVFGVPSLPPVPSRIKDEIAGYKGVADDIINLSVHGKAQNQSYNRLAEFVDTFGSRIAGSQNLENAIDYMLKVMKADGLENVHGEDVMVPHWVRGNESCTMLEPRPYKVSILGLGSSIGTPPQGIKAEALVVHSFDELHSRASEAKGKIIIYDQGYVNYGVSVAYRDYGAVEAAKVGGVASLIRSVAAFSIHSPHTGWQDYKDNTTKVPTACIAVEDAEMFSRMAARGTKIVLHLKMEAKNLPDAKSRNTVAEIRGREHPEQVVLVSGHLDSWDVGQGAMDDGGGAFISWQALSLIRQLGLRPRRTLRAVLWTAEEVGLVGSQQYYQRHKANSSNYDLVMESDIGTFTPTGIMFTGSSNAKSIMTEVLSLLKPINSSQLLDHAEGGDVSFWISDGVPGGSLANQNERYFWFHHSDGDTMSVQDPRAMDLCSAVWAVTAYVVADMEDMLPRHSGP